MNEPPTAVSDALLAVVAAPEAVHSDKFAKLSDQEWHALVGLAQCTRTLPLLHHALGTAGGAGSAPAQVADDIARRARAYAIQSLRQGQALARVVNILRLEGMAPIALKGAALAFRDYPQPQLRPLRDVDLLLPVEEAVAARELLLARHGFEPHPAAATYGPELTHQLPEIRDRDSGLVVEFHHRLDATGWQGESRLIELIRADCEELPLLGETLHVPSAKANLLHLIEHAGRHHLFANGPLVLSDMHYLAARWTLDWHDIIAESGRLGLGRSLQIIAAVARRHGADWGSEPGDAPADDFVAAAEYAMLSDDETSRRHAQLARHERRTGAQAALASALTRAFMPDPLELARIGGQSPDSPKRWLGYPAWLREKGRRFLASRSDPQFLARQSGRAALEEWLKEPI